MNEVKMEENSKIIDNQYEMQSQLEQQKKEKYNSFKERLTQFDNIETLEDAKELAEKFFPTANEISRFYVGDAKCTIINKEFFRISLENEEEFISYDFE